MIVVRMLRGAALSSVVAVSVALQVACASLVPLDRSGHEIEHPMAVVILGGLVTSTVLNLVLLPAIYLRYGRQEPVS